MAILQAHYSLQPGKIYLSKGDLMGANINRSPSAYTFNPIEERRRYNANTDTLMTQLEFTSIDGTPLGVINWFAVHGMSFLRKYFCKRIFSLVDSRYALTTPSMNHRDKYE